MCTLLVTKDTNVNLVDNMLSYIERETIDSMREVADSRLSRGTIVGVFYSTRQLARFSKF